MELSEHALQVLIEQLIHKGSSEQELRLWQVLWPVMTEAERKELFDSLNKELVAIA